MEQTHPLDNVTVDNYQLPQGEEGIFHVVLEVKEFDRKTGERTSVPRVQKFGVNAFETAYPNLKRLGYDVRIVHDPTKWLAAQAERAAEEERQNTPEARQAAIEEALEKQRKEFEEKQQAAIEKAVAEALKAQSAGGAAVATPSEEAAPKKGAK